jgi:hypothetical protein
MMSGIKKLGRLSLKYDRDKSDITRRRFEKPEDTMIPATVWSRGEQNATNQLGPRLMLALCPSVLIQYGE